MILAVTNTVRYDLRIVPLIREGSELRASMWCSIAVECELNHTRYSSEGTK
jgi:hypothetical protein